MHFEKPEMQKDQASYVIPYIMPMPKPIMPSNGNFYINEEKLFLKKNVSFFKKNFLQEKVHPLSQPLPYIFPRAHTYMHTSNIHRHLRFGMDLRRRSPEMCMLATRSSFFRRSFDE